MVIIYIHGAKATCQSFNFIKTQVKEPFCDIEYVSKDGFYNNLNFITERLKSIYTKDKFFFVAHSLGGIYALHLFDKFRDKTLGAVTLSTPYGGSNAAVLLNYATIWKPQKLFQDITPYSLPIKEGHKIKDLPSWTNLVTTAGHNELLTEQNDGIVTLRSMRYRTDMKLIDIDMNHYEVVQSYQVTDYINKELERFKNI